MSSPNKNPRGRKPPNQHNRGSHNTPSDPHPKQPANQTQQIPNQNAPKEPGMFQRVAETAAGVAVGSTIGNLFTSAVSSLFGSGSDSKATPSSSTDTSEKICEREKLNFVHCTEKESDLSKCEELQMEYKECRVKYNLP